MGEANGERLLLAARLSTKKTGTARVDGVSIEIQDANGRDWAEREGHAIISTAADIKSGTSAPWRRKNLRPWMEDASLMAMYDGILVAKTDRLSRGTQEDFTHIEAWCVANGKFVQVVDGPRFPARRGTAHEESDYWQWTAQKRAARTEWESIRARQISTHGALKSAGHAVGKYPFGYRLEGEKYSKRVVIDQVNGPVAREAFQRIADGHTATSVALWLSEKTGQTWRVKRVTDMIQRRTYLGERDGHSFEPLVTQELFDQANAAMNARSFPWAEKGGRRPVHAYSGLIYCECGASLYRHHASRGTEKYRCSRGRRNKPGESRCLFGAPVYRAVNDAVDVLMGRVNVPDRVMVTTGGDYGKQGELQRIDAEMTSAQAKGDMDEVIRLATERKAVSAQPSEPIRTAMRETGKTYAQVWANGDLSDRRAMLARGDFRVTLKFVDGQWRVTLMWVTDKTSAGEYLPVDRTKELPEVMTVHVAWEDVA